MEFETEKDKIGRKEFVDKIASCADHLAEDRNICIAIDGEWGSGKSFVMEKLYERLNVNDSYLVVRYDAWECSFYDEPLFAIFSSILDCAKEKLSLLPGGKKGLKAVGKEIGKDALEELSKKSGKLGNLATFIKGFLKYIGIYKNGATIDTSDERSKEYKSYQSYLKEVQDSLNEYTTHSDYRGKKNKLIVLVDELDRCLPDMQLKILERLHHLFDVKNCAVICAVNEASVAKNVEATYGVDGYEYLRKFFDLNYKLEMSSSIYFGNLLDDFINTLVKVTNSDRSDWTYIDFAYGCLRYGSHNVLDKVDNREITRYYSCLNDICITFGWERLNPRYVFFLIVGLFIRKEVSQTFLNEDEITHCDNQVVDQELYFDYLQKYLGATGKILMEKMRGYSFPYLGNEAKFVWGFNEIVHFSIYTQQDNQNEFRMFNGQAPVIVKDCNELRQLVIQYGGEQKNA